MRLRALAIVHHDPAHAKPALLVAALHDYDAELAHYAAQTLVRAQGEDALQSDVRAVREEAALASHDVDAAGAMAMDDDEAPETRGRAIQVLIDAHSAAGHALLVQLAEPRHWFFGVQAGLQRLHSLTFIVEALDANERCVHAGAVAHGDREAAQTSSATTCSGVSTKSSRNTDHGARNARS